MKDFTINSDSKSIISTLIESILNSPSSSPSHPMAKKRKLESKPPQPHPQSQSIHDEQEDEEEEEEEEEEQQQQLEYAEELQQQDEDKEEDEDTEDNDDDDDEDNPHACNVVLESGPLESVLASFSKEALITLLSESAERHADVAERIRETAETDPSQRKIFVHGLKWDTTSEMLYDEFLKFGDIEDCRVVTDKATGKSKGYGFILYKNSRGARHALKEPQKMINNRMTACQLASLGASAAAMPLEPTQRKIYVSNVGAEIDPERLTFFFSRYGEIEEGPLGLDKETGKPKGFCLFVYKNAQSAKWALEEPYKQFEGVTLKCQKAIDGPKPQKVGQQNNKNKSQGQGQGVVGSSASAGASPVTVQGLSLSQQAVLGTLMAAQEALFGNVGGGSGLVHNSGVLGNQMGHGGYGSHQNVGVGNAGNVMGGFGNQGGFSGQANERGGYEGRSPYGGRPNYR